MPIFIPKLRKQRQLYAGKPERRLPLCQATHRTAYKKLLEKYPGVLKCKFLEKPLHNIIHDIDTADNEPCRAKVRALMPGTVKEVKGHQKWLELEKQGVIVKIKPDEPVTWSSALHLVPKDGDDIRVTSDFRPLNNRTI